MNNDMIVFESKSSPNEEKIKLQLQYEHWLSIHRKMCYYLPRYQQEWQQAVQLNTSDLLEEEMQLPFVDTIHEAPIRSRLQQYCRQLIKGSIDSNETNCTLVMSLIHAYGYDLFRFIDQIDVCTYIVHVLSSLVQSIQQTRLWQYGESQNADEKQRLLHQWSTHNNNHTRQIETLQTSIAQLRNQIDQMALKFSRLQRLDPHAVVDSTDLIGNDLHAFQLKQLERELDRLVIQLNLLTQDTTVQLTCIK